MDQVMELINTYVMPYWPWIVGVVLGLLILRYVVHKAVKIIGGAVSGGAALGGAGSWLSDRGVDLPGTGIFSIGLW